MATTPTLPDLALREAQRLRPDDQMIVMRQRWSHLLFLHWAWDPVELQASLPPGLHLDLHQGQAYLGVVPFWMDRVRPRFLPPLPALSWFLELNLRTYVHDERGTPGVWFYSLDCNNRIAVRIARTLFGLPYRDARQRGRRPRSAPEEALFFSRRHSPGHGENAFRYAPAHDAPPAPAAAGSLEFFLAERYVLFTRLPDGGLAAGRVWHEPYRLAPARVEAEAAPLFAANGFAPPDRPAAHAMVCSGVDVSIYPLRRLRP